MVGQVFCSHPMSNSEKNEKKKKAVHIDEIIFF